VRPAPNPSLGGAGSGRGCACSVSRVGANNSMGSGSCGPTDDVAESGGAPSCFDSRPERASGCSLLICRRASTSSKGFDIWNIHALESVLNFFLCGFRLFLGEFALHFVHCRLGLLLFLQLLCRSRPEGLRAKASPTAAAQTSLLPRRSIVLRCSSGKLVSFWGLRAKKASRKD